MICRACHRGKAPFVLFALALLTLSACSEEPQTQSEITGSAAEPPAQAVVDPARLQRISALAEEWSAEPSYAVNFNVLDPATNPASEVQASLFDPNDPHWGLPEDEGRELVEAYCGACHSLRLVMQQSMVETGWDATLTRMVTDRGMPEIQPDVRQSIMSYLTAHFGAEG